MHEPVHPGWRWGRMVRGTQLFVPSISRALLCSHLPSVRPAAGQATGPHTRPVPDARLAEPSRRECGNAASLGGALSMNMGRSGLWATLSAAHTGAPRAHLAVHALQDSIRSAMRPLCNGGRWGWERAISWSCAPVHGSPRRPLLPQASRVEAAGAVLPVQGGVPAPGFCAQQGPPLGPGEPFREEQSSLAVNGLAGSQDSPATSRAPRTLGRPG